MFLDVQDCDQVVEPVHSEMPLRWNLLGFLFITA